MDAVKNLAGDGQADVGLDWTWLDDVTAADWQRYHDLMRSQLTFTLLFLCQY